MSFAAVRRERSAVSGRRKEGDKSPTRSFLFEASPLLLPWTLVSFLGYGPWAVLHIRSSCWRYDEGGEGGHVEGTYVSGIKTYFYDTQKFPEQIKQM